MKLSFIYFFTENTKQMLTVQCRNSHSSSVLSKQTKIMLCRKLRELCFNQCFRCRNYIFCNISAMSSCLKLTQPLLELGFTHKSSTRIVIRVLSSSQTCFKDDKSGVKELSKKYSNTLFLPRTKFPVRVEGKKRSVKDEEIAKQCKFEEQYQWQRENRKPGLQKVKRLKFYFKKIFFGLLILARFL